jgi:hypothetical protein
MKTWIDRLREAPTEKIEMEIKNQKCQIQIAQRDLEDMERILAEKEESK